ncbi:SDR family NAD(P)-dependent oxidoreductase [Actinopolymorpha singaporensis]|uniref:NAD(P)-dependent dehydrogenase, short-chain alcohol dehydrogenase family n=1 Tax=Actinopolymorpha singaporensis TaxID=117157 RepID=A0A1H1TYT1_9ACTN|nr:NAD(P)-dependent dehydrogenase, short-chain alcohol dehydrogenase family [Actinopolymorpha singaporensis]
MTEPGTPPEQPTRVALVTGGSGGIGQAVSKRLAADGMAVAVHYVGNRARAEEVVDAITRGRGQAMAVTGDVADEEAMATAFDAVEEAFGGIDVLVNTAGIMLLGPVAEFDLAALDRMHRTNIRGTFVVDQQAARRLRSGGAIVNFSTSVKKLAMPGYAPYAASKGAVDAITLILARELRGRDITVCRARADRDRSLPEGQGPGHHREPGQGASAGTPGYSGGHRRGGRVPCRAGPLGQRPGVIRQRRHHLTPRNSHASHRPATPSSPLKTVSRCEGHREAVLRRTCALAALREIGADGLGSSAYTSARKDGLDLLVAQGHLRAFNLFSLPRRG